MGQNQETSQSSSLETVPTAIQEIRTRATRVSSQVRKTASKPASLTFSEVRSARTL